MNLKFKLFFKTIFISIFIFILLSIITYTITKENKFDFKVYAPFKYYQQFSLDNNKSVTNWGWNINKLFFNFILIWFVVLFYNIFLKRLNFFNKKINSMY
jgi:hypothetical protein